LGNTIDASSGVAKNEKNDRDIALIEAALYVSGRPLDLKTLGSVIGTRSKKKTQKLAREIVEEYNQRTTALEILELEDKRFVLQVKANLSSKVKRLATRPLLTSGPLRTLSYIAYRQPIDQKQVIDVRGSHAYGHVKQLIDMGLVDYEKKGRTKILSTTNYFADFFGLSYKTKTMKRQLRRIFSDFSNKDKTE
jgi:segregation and condensation protein B